MGVFLFLKQIVDMLYQWHFLDYGMVLFAVVLLAIQFVKEKKYTDLKKKIILPDILAVIMVVLETLSFFRDTSFMGTYVKFVSAFLLYFLGRVYGYSLFSKGRWLAIASYFVVYANFVYRFIQFGYKFTVGLGEEGLLNLGGFYYYKTDLACGILLSIIFVYFYGKNTLLKYITIFPVCGYMIFYSGARMEMAVLVCIYAMIIFHIINCNKGKNYLLNKRGLNTLSVVIYVLLGITFIVIACLPYDTVEVTFEKNGEITLLSKIMHARHVIWWNLLGYFSDKSFLVRCFGIDLGSDWMHSGCGDRSHSMYIKNLYATGYLGCITMVMFVNSVLRKIFEFTKRRQAFFCLCVWTMFLLIGLTIECLEYTQMSWFPMLFAGAILSCKGNEMTEK